MFFYFVFIIIFLYSMWYMINRGYLNGGIIEEILVKRLNYRLVKENRKS